MELSLFFARFLGILLTVICLGMLINKRYYHFLWQECIRQPIFITLFGMFDFILGLFIILLHNVWIADWRLLITLLGWILFIRGAIRILAPVYVQSAISKLKESNFYAIIKITAVLFFLIGIFLIYVGFYRF